MSRPVSGRGERTERLLIGVVLTVLSAVHLGRLHLVDASYRECVKWLEMLSHLLVGPPFLALSGLAVAFLVSAHGDVGRLCEGCAFAAGALACAALFGLIQVARRNREADDAIARRAEWDADRAERDPYQP